MLVCKLSLAHHMLIKSSSTWHACMTLITCAHAWVAGPTGDGFSAVRPCSTTSSSCPAASGGIHGRGSPRSTAATKARSWRSPTPPPAWPWRGVPGLHPEGPRRIYRRWATTADAAWDGRWRENELIFPPFSQIFWRNGMHFLKCFPRI